MNTNRSHILPPSDTIDFNKLGIIVRSKIVWILLIFVAVNTAAYLVIRYSQDRFESKSELKLDIKNDATELGIKTIVEEQNLNIISGEIELLQSRLFLTIVLDSIDIDVSFFSKGEFLNTELYKNFPATVLYKIKDPSYYDQAIPFEIIDSQSYQVIFPNGNKITGKFGERILTDGIELTLKKNKSFHDEKSNEYFFVINSRELLLDNLIKSLSVEPLNFNANTIRISFIDKNPVKARDMVNKIDSVYLVFSNEQKNLANKQKIEWLNDELRQIEEKMDGVEDYFENFTLQNRTLNLDEDLQRTVTMITAIDSQRFDVGARLQQINLAIEDMGSVSPSFSLANLRSLPDNLSRDLEFLQKQMIAQERLGLSYSEVTFAFKQNQKEIDALRKKIEGQLIGIKKELLTSLQNLNRKKNQLESEFVRMPDKSTQYTKNQRFYKLYEQFYLMLIQSRSEFEIAQAGSIPDFKILSPANIPQKPISPNKLMIAGIGLVGSFVMMFFFIGILYLLNNKIINITELERIEDAPVLGVIPVSKYGESSGLHIVDHPKSMVSEAVRTLRTNLDFFKINSSNKVIAISSTVSGEGKSFIAMNLGGVIALSKKKVIMLDVDMRKPKSSTPTSETDRTKGMSTILIKKHKWQDCVYKTFLEGFDYIPSGPHPPNPSELLLNGEFSEMLEEMKQHYDCIILDTPPVGLVTDGIMAMKRADISIYVFRANYSKREFLMNLKRIINMNNFKNITSVLNAMPSSKEKYGYGYYEDNDKSTFSLKSLFKK